MDPWIEFLISPTGALLLFSSTFGATVLIGLPFVFRKHDREMAEILKEARES